MGDRPTGVGEPLTASVVEQLRQKARTEQELEASRAADEQREQKIDRLKEEQQAVSLQHAGDPDHWAEARQAAHRAPVSRRPARLLGLAQLALVAAGAAVLGALLRRR